ncbi:hypothetical protein F53441_6820 [Fusarium austroafricanum]|uniref:Uncharacterized protein n=1 Tax=Fusarium austroafricanum TaxID=2364996 RepID=A0A8H4P6K9_9HYPO|nr:hypothetical protein F53441_6820 [Fusarium austroafricanum]
MAFSSQSETGKKQYNSNTIEAVKQRVYSGFLERFNLDEEELDEVFGNVDSKQFFQTMQSILKLGCHRVSWEEIKEQLQLALETRPAEKLQPKHAKKALSELEHMARTQQPRSSLAAGRNPFMSTPTYSERRLALLESSRMGATPSDGEGSEFWPHEDSPGITRQSTRDYKGKGVASSSFKPLSERKKGLADARRRRENSTISSHGSDESTFELEPKTDDMTKPPAISQEIVNDSDDENDISTNPATNVLYIATSRYKELRDESSWFQLKIYPSVRRVTGSVFTVLDPKTLGNLEQFLGPGLCSQIGRKAFDSALKGKSVEAETAYLHQMVFTMMAARATRRISLALRPWEMISGNASYLNDLVSHDMHPKLVIFLPTDSMIWQQQENLIAVYNALQAACVQHPQGNARVYPTWYEAFNAGVKMADIRAFDTVAKTAPFAFSYRPKTCFGHGVCILADQETTIFKGTFSWGSSHIRELECTSKEAQGLIRCTQGGKLPKKPVRRPLPRVSGDLPESMPGRQWFHQEKIDALQRWRQLRVFMAGDDIVEIGYSFMSESPAEPAIKSFQAEWQFKWIKKKADREAKVAELKSFCRWWRRQLLDNYGDLFETLRVGVRFDIGISEESPNCRFFINDAVRWMSVPFCSADICIWPHAKICTELGKRFAREFGEIPRGEGEEEEEDGESTQQQQKWGAKGWGDYDDGDDDDDDEGVEKGDVKKEDGKKKGKQVVRPRVRRTGRKTAEEEEGGE